MSTTEQLPIGGLSGEATRQGAKHDFSSSAKGAQKPTLEREGGVEDGRRGLGL